jgi:hypothetical protein
MYRPISRPSMPGLFLAQGLVRDSADLSDIGVGSLSSHGHLRFGTTQGKLTSRGGASAMRTIISQYISTLCFVAIFDVIQSAMGRVQSVPRRMGASTLAIIRWLASFGASRTLPKGAHNFTTFPSWLTTPLSTVEKPGCPPIYPPIKFQSIRNPGFLILAGPATLSRTAAPAPSIGTNYPISLLFVSEVYAGR